MRTQSPDTPPDIEEMQAERYRGMTPAQKLREVQELNRSVLLLALAGIRRRFGSELSEREMRLRLAALCLDRQIMIEVFGWDPEIEGY